MNSAGNIERGERARIPDDYERLATVVAATAMLFVATIGLQFTQMKTFQQAQWQLKDLSDRNCESAKLAQAASDAKSCSSPR
ncbi:hypothetical protein [Yoonia sediminilitoris]|uniref:Uncharacterized protein n=1 Tax=Yoonia sediminilitoris TaxID=1286148 RepID=A0A2T6KJR1_9RHOB|nr:hypothetical protein [Yoonia sediminilitoris]PUB16204.1 hypothetical protein C8N45_10357 [Yoonia sediminilitoris]RCW96553.1 hypothetical protein DFP92_10357 [Yoonia sediminilitoris]